LSAGIWLRSSRGAASASPSPRGTTLPPRAGLLDRVARSIDVGPNPHGLAVSGDGSRVLVERLKGKITVDRDTARRLFTLICALHWKG